MSDCGIEHDGYPCEKPKDHELPHEYTYSEFVAFSRNNPESVGQRIDVRVQWGESA